MATLKQTALDFEPQQYKNIADLEIVDVEVPVEKKVFKQGTPDEFEAWVFVKDGEEYRVPNSVLADIKILAKENPNIKSIEVKKSGEGKTNTRYMVIPMG